MKIFISLIITLISLEVYSGPIIWSFSIARNMDYSNQSTTYQNGQSAIGAAALLNEDLLDKNNIIGASNPSTFCQLHGFDVAPYTCVAVGSDRVKITVQHMIKYTIKSNYILQVQAKKNTSINDDFVNITVNNTSLTENYILVWGPKNGTDNNGTGYENVNEFIDIGFEFYIKGSNFRTEIDNMIDFYTEVIPL